LRKRKVCSRSKRLTYARQEELAAAYEDAEKPENVAYEESWVWRLPEKAPW
jgi:hypothetical protein